MKKSLCGANCAQCPSKEVCPGCAETKGCPFGKQCFLAKYILDDGMESFQDFKRSLIGEVNALHIEGMETVTELYPLVGNFVNLEYPLPNGTQVKFLHNDEMYLGTQVKDLRDDSGKTCFGVIAREHFLLVCRYSENCTDPKIVIYKSR